MAKKLLNNFTNVFLKTEKLLLYDKKFILPLSQRISNQYKYYSTTSNNSKTSFLSFFLQPNINNNVNMLTRQVGSLSLSNIWNKIKIKRSKYRKSTLKNSSLRLYLCCMELVHHDTFIREFNLPDTLNSWFRITELHLWMIMVRLGAEGKEGVILRNNLMNFTWQDIDKKTRKFKDATNSTARQVGLVQMSDQFKAALFAYDEGLLDDDKVLAGALWRNFFDKNCDDPLLIEDMVLYVRKQISYLDKIESEELMGSGLVQFLPLRDCPDLHMRNKQIMIQILKRVQ